MNRTIRLITCALALSVAPAWAAADRPRDPEERLARMQQHLSLSDEQVAQILDIRANGGSRQDVHAILTEEQRQRIAQSRKHRRAGHRSEQRQDDEPDSQE